MSLVCQKRINIDVTTFHQINEEEKKDLSLGSITTTATTIHNNYLTSYDCSVCSLPICDQFVFKVNEHYFHALCLNCSECHVKLLEKCYTRDGRVFCQEDFFK